VGLKKKQALPVVDVPKNYEAANAVLIEYGEVERQLALTEARLAEKVAKLTVVIEKTAGPLKERRAALAARIMAYADENRDALLKDGGKSHRLPSGLIGWRSKPPSVTWKKGFTAEAIVAGAKALAEKLIGRGSGKVTEEQFDNAKKGVIIAGFVRHVEEPNKEAMLAHPELALMVDGVRIGSGGEVFYIEPVSAELSKGAP
jgi:phage host-nuclease inhibitor protein Gam